MKGLSNLIFAVIIFAVVIINIESAPVDPRKSTEKPSDANGVGDAAGVSTYLQFVDVNCIEMMTVFHLS